MYVPCRGRHFTAGSDLGHTTRLPENGLHEAETRIAGAYPQNLTKTLQETKTAETRQYTRKDLLEPGDTR